MKLRRNAWHRKVWDTASDKASPPNSKCGYVWGVFFSVIGFPLWGLLALSQMKPFSSVMPSHPTTTSLNERLFLGALVFMIGSCVLILSMLIGILITTSMLGREDTHPALVFVAGAIGIAIFATCLLWGIKISVRGAHEYTQHAQEAPDPKKTLLGQAKAWKRRNCPIIEWVDEEASQHKKAMRNHPNHISLFAQKEPLK